MGKVGYCRCQNVVERNIFVVWMRLLTNLQRLSLGFEVLHSFLRVAPLKLLGSEAVKLAKFGDKRDGTRFVHMGRWESTTCARPSV